MRLITGTLTPVLLHWLVSVLTNIEPAAVCQKSAVNEVVQQKISFWWRFTIASPYKNADKTTQIKINSCRLLKL